MKKINLISATVTILFSISAFGCSENPLSGKAWNKNEAVSFQSSDSLPADFSAVLESLPLQKLTQDIEDGLKYMREEEKLARDVYANLAAKWNLRTLNNIKRSEQSHMDAIKKLLDMYGVADPAENDINGKFVNEDIQKLYNTLMEKGNSSVTAALETGAAIEEVDIKDLQKEIAAADGNERVRFVYSRLLSASGNHLRAFVRNLKNSGKDYVPLYLDKDTYDKIIKGIM